MRLNRLGRLTMNNPARAALLRGYVGAKLTLLDDTPAGRTLVVGCGQGVDVEIALERFRATEVVAVDVDPHQIERARRRLGGRSDVSVDLGDVTDLGFEDASFDTVLDLGAVHLVPEWRLAYGEIGRVLSPGGTLRFETIVGRSFRAALRISTEGFRSPAMEYTEAGVLDALAAAGLSCDDSTLFRPRGAVLSGLVGDLIGVATKAR